MSHRYDDDDYCTCECSRRNENVVQVVQMDGDGHLKIQLAVPVAGQGLGDRFQYEFFCSHTKHFVSFMGTRVWRC